MLNLEQEIELSNRINRIADWLLEDAINDLKYDLDYAKSNVFNTHDHNSLFEMSDEELEKLLSSEF